MFHCIDLSAPLAGNFAVPVGANRHASEARVSFVLLIHDYFKWVESVVIIYTRTVVSHYCPN